MNLWGDSFDEALLGDLSAAAALLLDPWVAPSAPAGRGRYLPGTLRGLLEDIERLTVLVPRLIGELEEGSTYVDVVLERSPVPRRPTFSSSARDYIAYHGRVVPRSWYEATPVLERDPRPLAWVLWLVETLDTRLAAQQARLESVITRALLDREVDSIHAAREAEALRSTEGAVRGASAALERARESLLCCGTRRLRPSARRPSPMLSGRAWDALRVLADLISNPGLALRRNVTSALSRPVHIADRPFLYQRWVGLKVIEALQARGWTLIGDAVGALFLGGYLKARLGNTLGTIWFEPRILAGASHPSGLRATRKEQSPDIVLVVPGPGGRDAFILDPTLCSSPEHLREKALYLDTVEFVAQARVAGVPVRRAPCRSWAVTPTPRSACDLFNSSGSAGAISAWPLLFDPEPLGAWLADIEAHAVAWT